MNIIIKKLWATAKKQMLPKIVPALCGVVLALATLAAKNYPAFSEIITGVRDQVTNTITKSETTITSSVDKIATIPATK